MTTRVTVTDDARQLHAIAMDRTGLDDFGADTGYRAGLDIALTALRDDADNTPLRAAVMDHAVNALVGRLHSEAGWKRHPEVLDIPITAPVVITGMPRTGTSLLHQLMANDPQFQWMPGWIARAPRIRARRSEWRRDPEYAKSIAALEAVFEERPGLRAAHNFSADLPEECIQVLVQGFTSMRFVSTLPLPRYEEWFLTQDETPSYRRFADNLRLIGAREPSKTWLLKNPSHAIGIEALLRVFPDARIAVTYRDPRETIASGASVIARSTGEMWRGKEIGQHRLRVWARAAERIERARDGKAGRFADVSYERLLAEPIAVVRDLYRQFGLTLTPETEHKMQIWLEANPQGMHGSHVYSLEAVGLTGRDVDSALESYIARYGFAR